MHSEQNQNTQYIFNI